MTRRDTPAQVAPAVADAARAAAAQVHAAAVADAQPAPRTPPRTPPRTRAPRPAPVCACAHNLDGSVTTMLCSLHAPVDPCLTMARVTMRRRRGTLRRGRCTACGWQA